MLTLQAQTKEMNLSGPWCERTHKNVLRTTATHRHAAGNTPGPACPPRRNGARPAATAPSSLPSLIEAAPHLNTG